MIGQEKTYYLLILMIKFYRGLLCCFNKCILQEVSLWLMGHYFDSLLFYYRKLQCNLKREIVLINILKLPTQPCSTSLNNLKESSLHWSVSNKPKLFLYFFTFIVLSVCFLKCFAGEKAANRKCQMFCWDWCCKTVILYWVFNLQDR